MRSVEEIIRLAGGAEAVAVVEGPRVVGIVTRTDLVSALSQRLALVQMAS